MATITANSGFGEGLDNSPSGVILTDAYWFPPPPDPIAMIYRDASNTFEDQYTGSISFDSNNGAPIGGTISNIDEIFGLDLINNSPNVTLVFSISDLSLDVLTIVDLLSAGNARAYWSTILSGSDQIYGSNFNDKLLGYGASDHIFGGNGDDVLKGGGGGDSLEGESGEDTLNGGGGSDILFGGSGFDQFVFSSTLSSSNLDLISDFTPGDDGIRLDDDIFKRLATGQEHQLPASQYQENTAGIAMESDDRIIYDTDDGYLYYDPDGSGPKAAKVFAFLDGAPLCDEGFFTVIG